MKDSGKPTGLVDRDGLEIMDGDMVSLAGNMTADDSMGFLPNGWTFVESDIYEVYFDPRIKNWSLRMEVEPDTPYNIKYLNHALGLLHGGSVTVLPS